MTLVSLENISLRFSETPILDQINLQINHKEKIFIVGRNGMGKSCLLKVITGKYKADSGKLHYHPSLKIAELSQDLPDCDDMLIYDFVAQGLEKTGALLKRYNDLINVDHSTLADPDLWLKEMETTQIALDNCDGWQFQQIIETVLTKLDLAADKTMGSLSGGWKRRAALAKVLVAKPDLLLLDEPTNHLDLAAIEWLEEYLKEYNGSLLCITHDRSFLKNLSEKIIEIDRGHIHSWLGSYDKYLEAKSHRLEVEQTHNKLFDKVLAKEEAWIRQGVKARRTRNEGRVRALEQLRLEHQARRALQGKPTFNSNQPAVSGDLIVNVDQVNFKFHDKLLIKNLSLRVFKKDKIALVGPNGIGKSTLIKLLLGELEPQSGVIKQGTNLKIGYFDQLRNGLDYNLSAIDNVGGGREFIDINGKQKHVISYLADFLFTPDRVRMPLRMLSGGECNRLLLAKLFSVPSNVLVLDEPTNDLDIESLELLEEILIDYAGTILLVSHDRDFVNNVATSTLCFRGNGIIEENIGGFADIPVKSTQATVTKNIKINNHEQTISKKDKSPSLSNTLRKELDDLTKKISKLEAQQKEITQLIADPEFYNQDKIIIQNITTQFNKIEKELHALYSRWEEIDGL